MSGACMQQQESGRGLACCVGGSAFLMSWQGCRERRSHRPRPTAGASVAAAAAHASGAAACLPLPLLPPLLLLARGGHARRVGPEALQCPRAV